MLIDPGDDAPSIFEALAKHDLALKYMLCTHGHMDHIAASGEIKASTGAQIYIHEKDQWLVDDLPEHCRYLGLQPVDPPGIDAYYRNGEALVLCGLNFEIISTPGHTPGGVCLHLEDHLFVGDTLFHLSIGRCDLPGGNYEQLMSSIWNNLLPLKDSLIVHSGHGEDSTLGIEKVQNPFLAVE